VLYRVVTVDEGAPTAFSVALERGNIRSIGEQDAALFQPPGDFKETK
jgi:predicted amidohydrolase YtcJ